MATTAGFQYTRASLDSTMGNIVTNLRNALNEVVSFNAQLNDSTLLTDAVLTALGYTGPSGTAGTDEALIRAAFTDLQKLSDIGRGLATQSPANDFWFNAKHLTNPNFHA